MANGETIRTICIDGPAASGKTTLSRALMRLGGLNEETQLIHGDWYFERWPENRLDHTGSTPGFFNDERFMEEVGTPLMQNQSCRIREAKFVPGGNMEFVERPTPRTDQLIVVEGIKLLGLPIEWDVKIWMDTPRAIREERFMARTNSERKSELLADEERRRQAFDQWADDAERYERQLKPYTREDILVVNGAVSAEEQLVVVQSFVQGH